MGGSASRSTVGRSIKMDVTIAVYLRGDALNPRVITSAVGVESTTAHAKGDIAMSSGREKAFQKTGVWIWRSEPLELENELADAVNVLSRKFSRDLSGLPGVEDAWVDVLLLEPQGSSREEQTFGLAPSDLVELAKLGLPVYFTIGRIGG